MSEVEMSRRFGTALRRFFVLLGTYDMEEFPVSLLRKCRQHSHSRMCANLASEQPCSTNSCRLLFQIENWSPE